VTGESGHPREKSSPRCPFRIGVPPATSDSCVAELARVPTVTGESEPPPREIVTALPVQNRCASRDKRLLCSGTRKSSDRDERVEPPPREIVTALPVQNRCASRDKRLLCSGTRKSSDRDGRVEPPPREIVTALPVQNRCASRDKRLRCSGTRKSSDRDGRVEPPREIARCPFKSSQARCPFRIGVPPATSRDSCVAELARVPTGAWSHPRERSSPRCPFVIGVHPRQAPPV
jgi:hypothetical protein